jgi:ubiquinone/menaquinone biosynthesis C-methylase UbiE
MYWKAESALVPGLRSSQYCYYEKLRPLVPGKVWLDLGCGHQVFGDWMTKEQAEVVESSKKAYGIDLDWKGLRAHPDISNKIYGDLARLPLKDGSIDVVSANMVVEHLAEPEMILQEIHRVLTPNGAFIFHTPNYRSWVIQIASRIPEAFKKRLLWFLERRREEDVFPAHYRMNTDAAVRQKAGGTGFTIEEITMVSSSAATVMLGPVVLAELLYIRRLQHPGRANLRSNIVAILRKSPEGSRRDLG